VNPYYLTGFSCALIFWVWPAFLYNVLDAHWAIVVVVSALLFVGCGRAATEFHIRFIAPRDPPRGRPSSIVAVCLVIVGIALLTRVVYRVTLQP
jgi:hypothetical protein